LPFKVLRLSPACSLAVSELEDCRTGHYCFSLALARCHADGRPRCGGDERATLCMANSHEQILWLQALVANNASYVEATAPSASAPIAKSFFELQAKALVTGEEVGFAQYQGCVTLVVNVASR